MYDTKVLGRSTCHIGILHMVQRIFPQTSTHVHKHMKYVLILILLLTFGSIGHTEDQMWDGKAMFCACTETSAKEKYYGLLFYSGKVKKLSIHKDTLHIPDDAVGNSYSLVKVFSSKKIFWRGLSGINSLDRRNLIHLLDGKVYGWCRPDTQRILTERLLEKIQEKQFGKVSRSIADDLR